ncbi:hypothetical protein NARC_10117 [Candidatus Nitrosocosmicus arcticus]|uniref:Uncharacterized protein n=1 Tax=Candidatus Nitrosocosmicus arcticus TaxID=2035267 RepID=A0A557SYN2_9ARCH|nr:hypothetical protein NARC_10117 [Candidatus Nitrosocosmicus arcticus]
MLAEDKSEPTGTHYISTQVVTHIVYSFFTIFAKVLIYMS